MKMKMKMKISAGYLKDLLAFIASVILIICYYLRGKSPPNILLPIGIGLVFTFDGIFSLYPWLHNYQIIS